MKGAQLQYFVFAWIVRYLEITCWYHMQHKVFTIGKLYIQNYLNRLHDTCRTSHRISICNVHHRAFFLHCDLHFLVELTQLVILLTQLLHRPGGIILSANEHWTAHTLLQYSMLPSVSTLFFLRGAKAFYCNLSCTRQ